MKSNFPVFRSSLTGIVGLAVFGATVPMSIPAQTATSIPPLASPPAPAAPISLPYGAVQVMQMYQLGTNKTDIFKFIKNTAVPYHLTPDQILYMHNLGVPHDVVDALATRGSQLEQQKQVPPPAVVAGGDSHAPASFPHDDYYPEVSPYSYGGPFVLGGYGYSGGTGSHFAYGGAHAGLEIRSGPFAKAAHVGGHAGGATGTVGGAKGGHAAGGGEHK